MMIITEVRIWHGPSVPADRLTEGQTVLFGGKVFEVSSAEFSPENSMDIEIRLTSYDKPSKSAIEQRVIVSRKFDFQTLEVIPANTSRKENIDD